MKKFLLLASIVAFACTPIFAQKKPNVIVILMDDLGYGDLSCYGASQYQTPNLDQMAKNGIRLTNFLSAQAVCSASRAGLLTGCYPNRIGISGALFPNSPIGISTEEETIAEILKANGYATGIFGKWHLGDSERFLPTQHGFDEYVGIPYSNDMWPVHFDGTRNVTNQRKTAASSLSDLITEKLNQLSFNDATFRVELIPSDPSMHGNESIQFLVSTFKGGDLQPIQKVLSGGELSRISLAIRVASIANIDVPTMIFDEVDVGIGGGVAEVVGNLLKDLGDKKNTQALVITHLPQVAAKANNHYKVSKNQAGDSITSKIHHLNESERIDEIARMLGGIKVTDKAIDHAKEILG